MNRRTFAAAALGAAVRAAAEDTPVTVRGRLSQTKGQPSVLIAEGGKRIPLQGDEQTTGVLGDPRLKDMDFEMLGQLNANGTLVILPIHKRGMYVHKDGKRLFVTYWCEVCAIRTYTPGICWCCQDETALDLKDKLDN